MLSWAQEPLPPVKTTYQQTRRSSRQDLEVKISVNLASLGNSSQAKSIPVNFTVKNISMAGIGLAHYGDDYTQNVEIFEANKLAELPEQNRLFPFPGAGGGSAKEIAPGESLNFVVPVPISLFRMKDVQFIAGVRYGVGIAENEAYEGEALSEPFLLPPIPGLTASVPTATPLVSPQPPIFPTETPAPIVEDRRCEWLWAVGILGLLALFALALKRRG